MDYKICHANKELFTILLNLLYWISGVYEYNKYQNNDVFMPGFTFFYNLPEMLSNLTLFNMYLGASDVHQLRNKKKIVL